jgi:2-polyprenyl-3-methyl-5-hydroxy-6-metoxy-1,4-benzoquinol methylase
VEQTLARYDAIADFYRDFASEPPTSPVDTALLDLVGDVSGLRLLDLACGHGRFARELARRGAEVVGIDISAALIAKARAAENAAPLGVT